MIVQPTIKLIAQQTEMILLLTSQTTKGRSPLLIDSVTAHDLITIISIDFQRDRQLQSLLDRFTR